MADLKLIILFKINQEIKKKGFQGLDIFYSNIVTSGVSKCR